MHATPILRPKSGFDLQLCRCAVRVDVWRAVRTFVNEQCNASRAAARLYAHRNALLRQLSRADQLLPQPLSDNSVNVAVALDVLNWRGGGNATP